MSRPVVIVPTGTANLASVKACLHRLGHYTTLATGPEQVAAADRVVFPGVGTFGAAIAELRNLGLVDALRRRFVENRPTLTVCVGMQLLASRSDESPGQDGLGVIAGTVTRFPDHMRVPQLGWNQVWPDNGSRFVTPGWAYFANSYRLESPPPGWSTARADHGGSFVAAAESGDLLACQFHPELSGEWGSGIVDRWLKGAAS